VDDFQSEGAATAQGNKEYKLGQDQQVLYSTTTNPKNRVNGFDIEVNDRDGNANGYIQEEEHVNIEIN
jgi:hypothetical protein